MPRRVPVENQPAALPSVPEGAQRLATGRRGAHLYRVVSPGGVYWVAEMTLAGKLLRRRHASELHARAWLAVSTELHPTATPFDLEEINGPFRAACVTAADHSTPVRRFG